MPDKVLAPGIGGRVVTDRPCILCGGPRDHAYAYTTNQGRRSVRLAPRCRDCENRRRKDYHAADRTRSRDNCREWRAANPDYGPAYNRARQSDSAVRARKAYHQRLRKARMRSGQKDNAAIREIYHQAKVIEKLVACCPVFGLPELGHEMQVDHITPLSRGGLHHEDNLQILPKGLNMRKGAKCPK